MIEKWSVVPATAARKSLWRESVLYDPESGEERPESGYHSRRTGRVIKPSSIRRHSPPFQPQVVSAQKESPLSNYSCHVCGMKARNASEWKCVLVYTVNAYDADHTQGNTSCVIRNHLYVRLLVVPGKKALVPRMTLKGIRKAFITLSPIPLSTEISVVRLKTAPKRKRFGFV